LWKLDLEKHLKVIGVQKHIPNEKVLFKIVNRLSFNSFISHKRKLNLPLDASAKVVGPRLLHTTQWGIIDPVDTPDGGNVGLHKHMAIRCYI
jgi:DNA-directed RNA polymerase II subunit RPB2